MSTTAPDANLLAKAEEILKHLETGGTLKAVVNLADEELEAIYAVAYNYFTARKFDQAVQLFKFLCLYDHMEPRWAYGLGIAQQQRGDFAAALNAYGLATLLDIEDPRPQVQAGYCLMATNQWPEAVSALEGAVMACADDARYAGLREQAENMLVTAREKAGKP